MKLTIWEQFSSNHSASYTIVAVFKSGQEAETAKKQVEGILLDIADWYTEDESRLYGDVSEISPIEIRIAAEYQIEWKEPLLWFENTQMKTEKEILIIVPEYPTDSGTVEIEALLQKMGAQVAVDGGFHAFDDSRYGFIEISCAPPNSQIAEALLQRHKGSYQADTGRLNFGAFRFYPIRDFLELIRELEREACQDIEISVYDRPIQ